MCTFQPRNVTCWDSEGVKCMHALHPQPSERNSCCFFKLQVKNSDTWSWMKQNSWQQANILIYPRLQKRQTLIVLRCKQKGAFTFISHSMPPWESELWALVWRYKLWDPEMSIRAPRWEQICAPAPQTALDFLRAPNGLLLAHTQWVTPETTCGQKDEYWNWTKTEKRAKYSSDSHSKW